MGWMNEDEDRNKNGIRTRNIMFGFYCSISCELFNIATRDRKKKKKKKFCFYVSTLNKDQMSHTHTRTQNHITFEQFNGRMNEDFALRIHQSNSCTKTPLR